MEFFCFKQKISEKSAFFTVICAAYVDIRVSSDTDNQKNAL